METHALTTQKSFWRQILSLALCTGLLSNALFLLGGRAAAKPRAKSSKAGAAQQASKERADEFAPPSQSAQIAAQSVQHSVSTASSGSATYGGIIYGYGGYSSGLVMINPDGTNAINITDTPSYGSASYPSVSSQTGMVAFQGGGIDGFDSHGPPHIFVMNGDGTGVKQLTFPTDRSNNYAYDSRDTLPRIFPDGTKVAFISDRNAGQTHQCTYNGTTATTKTGTEVWIVNVDGTNLHQVTTTKYMDNYSGCAASETDAVAWSPDSQSLVVRGYREYDYQVISGGGISREVPVLATINADGTNEQVIAWGFQNQKDPTTGLDLERVGTAHINASCNILDWSPAGNILYCASFSNPFYSDYENSHSLGFLPPSPLPPDTAPTYKLAQDLMGQTGYNGSTDGKPHGGDIFDARYSPDGSQVAIIGVSPLANNNMQSSLFVANVSGAGSATPVPNTNGANGNNGLAWKPGAAIPQPAQLTLTPNPLLLYDQEVVQEVPTLLDAQGNVIVRAAVWHAGNTGFVCDNTPDEIPCYGYPLGSNDIDFTGVVTGRNLSTDTRGNLCATNGALRACVPYEDSPTATAVTSVAATQPTANLSGAGGPGVFTISRDNDPRTRAPKLAVNVNFSLGGTAQRDVDYALDFAGNTVTIPGGQTSVNINVRPLGTRGDKTVTLTVQPDPANYYLVSNANSATVQIKDDGATTPALSLQYVTPNSGNDQSVVSPTIYGLNIQQGANVKLSRNGQADINGQNIQVAANGSSINAQFNLVGQAQGAWDVVVTNPDNTTARLAAAFTIQPLIQPHIWVDLMGRDVIRASHTATTYTIVYGNTGNVDAYAVPLFVTGIPTNAEVNLKFNVTQISQLPIQQTLPASVSQIPNVVSTGTQQVIPLLLPVVRAGSSNYLQFTIRFSQIQQDATLSMGVFASPPLLKVATGSQASAAINNSSLEDGGRASFATPQSVRYVTSNEGLDCLHSFLQSIVNCGLGFIPGEACLTSALSFIQTSAGFGTDLALNGVSTNPLNYAQLFSGGLSAATCAASVTPGLNLFFAAVSCGANLYSTYNTCLEDSKKFNARMVQSSDPNEKVETQGVSDQHYISGLQPSRYSIYFENQPTATAPAQSVLVTDKLDTTKLDLSTFSLGLMEFGGQLVTPPSGVRSFDKDVDLRPGKNLIVRIHAALDPQSGIVTWKFTSIDPATNQPTTDPTAGFLPPDTDGIIGEGNALFTVRPKAGLADGTQVNNKATITFDLNAPMDTNTFSNTIDNSKPQSRVNALPATSCNNFNVNWSGTDSGSGIQSYTIYVSDNGGAFSAWQLNTTQTSAAFNGQSGHTYAFYSVARDNAGNVEDAPSSAEATTNVAADTTAPTINAVPSSAPNAAGWYNQNVSVALNATDGGACSSGVSQVVYSASGAQTIASTTVNGATASVPVTSEGVTTITYQAKDNAGNQSAPQTLIVKLDKTPPVVTCAAPSANWSSTDVSVQCTATDGNSSLANSADAKFTPSTNVASGTETSGAQTNSRKVCDVAGNCSAAGPVGGIRIDKKAPSINVIAPANATYNLGQLVVANYSCADGGAGLQSCTATLDNRLPLNNLSLLDTLLLGTHTVTVTAMDKVGNKTTQSVTYTVALRAGSATPTADLSLTMDAPSQVSAGQNITYTIKVKNAGPGGVPNAYLYNLEIPQGATLVSASTTQGSLSTHAAGSATGLITGNLGTLNKGDTVTVTVVMKVASPTTLREILAGAAVSANVFDPQPLNNIAAVSTRIKVERDDKSND